MGTDTAINDKPTIFFDGVCNLCNGAVQFVIKRDRKGRLQFASLQSDIATESLKGFDVDPSCLDSIVLMEKGKVYEKSQAIFRISRHLGFPWYIGSYLRFLPKWLTDPFYDFIAKRRYKWFGRRDQCMIPTPELSSRFL